MFSQAATILGIMATKMLALVTHCEKKVASWQVDLNSQ